MKPKHIVVIDHGEEISEVLSALLADLGYRVSVAKDAEAMHAFLNTHSIDLIVLDASTPETPGVSIALDAKAKGVRLMMISGNPKMMELFHGRADQLLWKPFTRDVLNKAVRVAFASDVYGQRAEGPEEDPPLSASG